MICIKICRIGRSLGISLPEKVASRLGAKEGNHLYLIETAEGGYRILPYNPELERKMDKVRDIMDRYSRALLALSR